MKLRSKVCFGIFGIPFHNVLVFRLCQYFIFSSIHHAFQFSALPSLPLDSFCVSLNGEIFREYESIFIRLQKSAHANIVWGMAPVLGNRTRLNISPEPPLSPEAGQSSSCSFSQLPNLDCTDPGALSRLKLRGLAPVVEVGDLPYSVLHIPVETSHGHMTVFHGLSVKSS